MIDTVAILITSGLILFVVLRAYHLDASEQRPSKWRPPHEGEARDDGLVR
jgi:hypothetical protein